MKRSGDLAIGRSGDREGHLSAPPRLRGEIRFPDHPIARDHPITRFMQLITAALREIFDESAYERFLLRTSAPRSVASYRDFMRDRETAMAKKPRCC